MQIISFTHETFCLVKRIAEDGTPDASLAGNAADLNQLLQSLEKSITENAAGMLNPSSSQDDQDLYKAAVKCHNVAGKIEFALTQISVSRTTSFGVLRAAAKAWWKSLELGCLKDDLKRIQDIVNISLAKDIGSWGQLSNISE
jgi:hypothetical protein